MEEWATTVAMSEPIETHIPEEREVRPYFFTFLSWGWRQWVP